MKLATIPLLFPLAASAAGSYECAVVSATSLAANGEMKRTSFTKAYEGQKFIVNRETGQITSEVISNSNGFGQPEVLDLGSSEQSFKALTVFRPKVAVDYLMIQSFVEGPKKPFLFLSGGLLMSGKCFLDH